MGQLVEIMLLWPTFDSPVLTDSDLPMVLRRFFFLLFALHNTIITILNTAYTSYNKYYTYNTDNTYCLHCLQYLLFTNILKFLML